MVLSQVTGNLFQLVALVVQGSLDESSEIFITRLCKLLCRSHDDQQSGSFLKQRISMGPIHTAENEYSVPYSRNQITSF